MQLHRNNRLDHSTFVATLSTAHGTHYVLTISNLNKFKAFFYHELNSYANANNYEEAMMYSNSVEKAWELREKYYSGKSALIKETDTDNEAVLNKFLHFMEEADMGITVFETDATFETFTKVSLTMNGNTNRSKPCK